jgi:hypothetical protein
VSACQNKVPLTLHALSAKTIAENNPAALPQTPGRGKAFNIELFITSERMIANGRTLA